MDRENLTRLRLDVRLTGRSGWISAEELERELSVLPDVTDKIAVAEPAEPASGAGTGPAT